MSEISLVGGLLLGSLAGVTHVGMAAIQNADVVLHPGDWTGPALQAACGPRLESGRSLTLDDVFAAAETVSRLVVLYCGAPPIATGRGDAFPSALRLRQMLREAGHTAEVVPGISAVQAAALEAGLDLCTAARPGLTMVSLEHPPSGLRTLRAAAQTDAAIALMWFEDHARASLAVLHEERPDQLLTLVRNLGGDNVDVLRGTTSDLAPHLARLPAPAVLFSQVAGEHAETRRYGLASKREGDNGPDGS